MIAAAVALAAGALAAEPARFDFVEIHMACEVRIHLYAQDEAQARAAARRAFDRVHAWDEALTDWNQASPAMRLPSSAGATATVDGRLATALAAAARYSRETDGAFDASLGAVTRLWRAARRSGKAPAAETLAQARAACGAGAWSFDAATGRFTALRDGVRMDFGGVGQGLAADDALAALREDGCASAMVDVSGDIAVGAPPPGRAGWTILVEPEFGGQPAERLELHDCGVSTSGDRAQRAEVDGRTVSHILDPSTGVPLARPRQATVVAGDATTADALATALCVMTAERCQRTCAALRATARLDRTAEDGGVRELPGWRQLRRASSSPAVGPKAPEAPRPSPAPEASGPPCSR